MSDTRVVTLTEFLLARIAEDEAELGAWVHRDEGAGPNGLGWAEVGAISEVLMVSHSRALAECEAKRRIVDDCADVISDAPDEQGWAVGLAERTLWSLAFPYSDHPDFREEWRP